jgi:hypothetical protein
MRKRLGGSMTCLGARPGPLPPTECMARFASSGLGGSRVGPEGGANAQPAKASGGGRGMTKRS